MNINKKATSNKRNRAEAKRKLNDHIMCYTKLLKDLSEETKLVSARFDNGHNTFNDAKFPEKMGHTIICILTSLFV